MNIDVLLMTYFEINAGRFYRKWSKL